MIEHKLQSGWRIKHQQEFNKRSLKRRDEWIAALRSGYYKQGIGELKSKDGYCCLGVLHDIEGTQFHKKPDRDTWFVYHGDPENNNITSCSYVGEDINTLDLAGTLPTALMIYNPVGTRTRDAMCFLASINDYRFEDGSHIPFAVIADIIEYCFTQA